MRPFHLAAQFGHVAVAEHLAARGAETRVRLPGGGPRPLDLAKQRGHRELAAFLHRRRIAATAAVVIIFENLHPTPHEVFLVGGGAGSGDEAAMGTVAPGESKELSALPGQIFRILAAPSDPSGRPVVRKYKVKPAPRRQPLVLKPKEEKSAFEAAEL